MQFLPEPEPLPAPPHDARSWRYLLFLSAAVGALATMPPWTRVRFERLFGEVFGTPAWQSTAGFTCLCTCAMVVVMTLAESQSAETHKAVRPASLFLVGISALTLLVQWWNGPGQLRGTTASWTAAFYVALAALPVLLLACIQRERQRRR